MATPCLYYSIKMGGRYAIVVAGGSGTRMQSNVPKQFMPLGGLPMLAHSLKAFYEYDREISLILVLPVEFVEYWKDLAAQCNFNIPHFVIHGGKERFYSVKAALNIIHEEKGLVAVHDAARPFVSQELIAKCYDDAMANSSAVPSLPLSDSIRALYNGHWQPADRSHYRVIQTPQVFDLALLKKAYHQPYIPLFTDDATVYELAGYGINLVDGERKNWKVTTAEDMNYAQYLMENR